MHVDEFLILLRASGLALVSSMNVFFGGFHSFRNVESHRLFSKTLIAGL